MDNILRPFCALVMLMAFMLSVKAQNQINGKITNATTGEPLIGASIIIKTTTIGTTSDQNGDYSLTIPSGMEESITVSASYAGYSTMDKIIPSTGGTLNFSLKEGLELSPIMITARKREQRLLEIPVAAQAIKGKTLETLGARDLTEVITLIPGASEGFSNSVGFRRYQLRGIAQDNGDPGIGYYIDDAAFNYFKIQAAPISRSYDINRVEVLRGPQSTLYGAGAMGGVIRYVTNKPSLNKIGGNVTGGISSTEGGEGSRYVDAMLNLPVVKDVLGIRVAGGFEDVGGYMESNDGTAEDFNDAEIYQVRTQILFTPISDLRFNFMYQINSADQNGGTFLTDTENTISSGNPGDFNNVGWDIFSATGEYDFKNFATLNTTTSRIGYDFRNSLQVPVPQGQLQFWVNTDSRAINHETRLVSNTDSDFQWLTGFYYLDSRHESGTTYSPDIGADGSQTSFSEQYSFFGEASLKLLDGRLIPLIGLRTFRDKRRAEDSRDEPVEDTFTSLNPRFNLSYLPTEKSNYFFNVAKGFRSGLFNQPQNIPIFEQAGLDVPLSVDSDELWSFELGTKQSLASGQIEMEAIAYTQFWKDQQFSPFVNNVTAIVSLGDTRIHGLDFGIGYSPYNTGLSLQFVANVNDATFNTINEEFTDFLPFEEGDRIPFVPRFNLGFNASYTRALGIKDWDFIGSTALTHVDSQYATDQNRTKSDPQTMLRMRLGVRNKNFGINLFGNNLLGENDALFASSQIFTQAYPRQLGVELSASF